MHFSQALYNALLYSSDNSALDCDSSHGNSHFSKNTCFYTTLACAAVVFLLCGGDFQWRVCCQWGVHRLVNGLIRCEPFTFTFTFKGTHSTKRPWSVDPQRLKQTSPHLFVKIISCSTGSLVLISKNSSVKGHSPNLSSKLGIKLQQRGHLWL